MDIVKNYYFDYVPMNGGRKSSCLNRLKINTKNRKHICLMTALKLFTFSRESWSQAARVLFNSLYILARSCSALI